MKSITPLLLFGLGALGLVAGASWLSSPRENLGFRIGTPEEEHQVEMEAYRIPIVLSTGETGIILTAMGAWKGESFFFVAMNAEILAGIIARDPVLGAIQLDDMARQVLSMQQIKAFPPGSWLLLGITEDMANAVAWRSPQSMGLIFQDGAPKNWGVMLPSLWAAADRQARTITMEEADGLFRGRSVYGGAPTKPFSGVRRFGLSLYEAARSC